MSKNEVLLVLLIGVTTKIIVNFSLYTSAIWIELSRKKVHPGKYWSFVQWGEQNELDIDCV